MDLEEKPEEIVLDNEKEEDKEENENGWIRSIDELNLNED